MQKKRRITAEQPQQGAGKLNLSHLLFEQQLGLHSSTYFRRRYAESLVQSVRLQDVYDSYDEQSTASMYLPYMQRRSAVLEIAVHGTLLFVLANNGLCSVVDMQMSQAKRLCYLNADGNDIIRSIILNTCDSNIIAVSFHADDVSYPNQLHCRSIPANRRSFTGCRSQYCAEGQVICEPVAHPGFVEFDEFTHRALLFNATTMLYKIYDLTNPQYTVLYCLAADGISDVKMSNTYLLLFKPLEDSEEEEELKLEHKYDSTNQVQQHQQQQQEDRAASCTKPAIVMEVMALANGMVLCRHAIPAPATSTSQYFEVLEVFDNMLLMKQALQPFKIYNVLTMAVLCSSDCESLSQVSSFWFLPHQHLFMTVSYHTLTTWNFKAEVVAHFEDHELWYPAGDNKDDPLVHITHGDWVISYCRPKGGSTQLPAAGSVGAIHISNFVTGKLVAKIEMQQSADEDTVNVQQRLLTQEPQQTARSRAWELDPHTGVTDVTALLYDEIHHVIYTGNHAGIVHKWAPG